MTTENNYPYCIQKALDDVDNIVVNRTTLGLTQYEYYVSKVNWNGETKPTQVLITNGPDILTSTSTIQLVFDIDGQADYYHIYGRIMGNTFGLISIVNNPDDLNSKVIFTDDGSITPDSGIILPNSNTTGSESTETLLFKSGRNLQARELNDIQRINSMYIENLGNAIYNEGDIIQGCSVIDSSTDDTLTIGDVNVKDGQMFILGKVRQIKGSTESIVTPSGGRCEIGLSITKLIKTEHNDPSRSDPDTESKNYNQPGAHALEYNIKWTVDEAGMLPIYTIENGILINKISSFKSNLGKLSGALEETIYDQSGDFVIDDVKMKLEDHEDDPSMFNIVIEPGSKLYIKGAKVDLLGKQCVATDRGNDIEFVNGAGDNYEAGTNLYKLNKYYVAEVSDFVAQIEITESVLKGDPNTSDPLANPTAVSISDVPGFTAGDDYTLINGEVDWDNSVDEPSTGSNYDVTYVYSRTMVKGQRVKNNKVLTIMCDGTETEFDLGVNHLIKLNSFKMNGFELVDHPDTVIDDGQTDLAFNNAIIGPAGFPNGSEVIIDFDYFETIIEGDYLTSDSYDDYVSIPVYNSLSCRDYIDLRTTGHSPVDTSAFTYDYSYYLGRIDLLYFSHDTFLPEIWKGLPSEDPRIMSKPDEGFIIAEIIIPPFTYSVKQVQLRYKFTPSYTMNKIKKLENRIENLEYYVLLDDLEKDALGTETANLKKGVFTDGFIGHDKIDFGYRIDVPADRAYIGVNKADHYGHLPVKVIDVPLGIDEANTTAYKSDEGFSLPYSAYVYKEQSLSSDTIFIQPFENAEYRGKLNIYPSADSWIDTEQEADKRVLFDQSNYNMVAYGQVKEGIETQWDSWRTLTTGVEDVGSFTKQSQSFSSNKEIFSTGTGIGELELETTTTTYNQYKKEKVTQFQERSGKKIQMIPETLTQDLGNRVIDNSIIPVLRQIPLRLQTSGLSPDTNHTIEFNGEFIEGIYLNSDKVGAEITNPYDPSPDHYDKFLAMEDFYINKSDATFTDNVLVHSDNDADYFTTNDKGKASVTIMIPANTFTGNIKIEIKSLDETQSETTAVFYGQGFQQTKQNVSASIKRTIQLEEHSIDNRQISDTRDVLVGVKVDTNVTSKTTMPPMPSSKKIRKYPPMANMISESLVENSSVSFVLQGKDGDPNTTGAIAYNVVSQPSSGVLTGTAPNLTYTPNTDFTGTDEFNFTTSKSGMTSSKSKVYLKVYDASEPPKAENIHVTLYQGESKNITLKGTDFQSKVLTYNIKKDSQKGVANKSAAPNVVSYRASTTSVGTDTFQYSVTNTDPVESNTAFVSVNVLKKPAPCKLKNVGACKGICDKAEWYAAANAWWARVSPKLSGVNSIGWGGFGWFWGWNWTNTWWGNWNRNLNSMWSWFPSIGNGDPFVSVGHWWRNVGRSFVYRSGNKGINRTYVTTWLDAWRARRFLSSTERAEWLRLWNCYMKIHGIFYAPVRRDPVAQSFSTNVDSGAYISGVEVFFKTKPSTSVLVALQEMKNGYPVKDKLVTTTLEPEQIMSSDDATIGTKFDFDDLIWIDKDTELCFSVFSSDHKATLYKATLGKEDMQTEKIITKQPAAGVLFKSPNASTWEPDGYSDLKFKLYNARFDESEDKYIYWNAISGDDFSTFCFDVALVEKPDTAVNFEYTLNAGSTWKSFTLNDNVELDSISNTLQVRCNINGTMDSSPIIKETASVKLVKYETNGKYIMRTMETAEEFDNVRVLYDINLPVGTDVDVYYSSDNGENWNVVNTSTTMDLGDGWTQYDFTETGIFPIINNLKLRLDMSTSDQAITPKIKNLRMLLY